MPTIVETLAARKSYLTTAELMELLQVRRNTICDWVRDGRITATRLGNSYRYDPHHVSLLLTASSTGVRPGGAKKNC